MSAGTRSVTGSYRGTGSALEVKVVGFRPRQVELMNKDGLAYARWTEEMADGSAFKIFNHADTQVAFVTTGGVTPLASGFSVGTDADLNTDGEEVYFVASD